MVQITSFSLLAALLLTGASASKLPAPNNSKANGPVIQNAPGAEDSHVGYPPASNKENVFRRHDTPAATETVFVTVTDYECKCAPTEVPTGTPTIQTKQLTLTHVEDCTTTTTTTGIPHAEPSLTTSEEEEEELKNWLGSEPTTITTATIEIPTHTETLPTEKVPVLLHTRPVILGTGTGGLPQPSSIPSGIPGNSTHGNGTSPHVPPTVNTGSNGPDILIPHAESAASTVNTVVAGSVALGSIVVALMML